MARQITEGDAISFNGKKYEFMEKVGEGGFGQVYKAKMHFEKNELQNPKEQSVLIGTELMSFLLLYTTNCTAAVKIVNKRNLSNPQDANREIQNMKLLNHENIIKLYDAMEISLKDGENLIYLFMEYARFGDLHNFIKMNDVSENKAKDFFCQIISGAEYLHSKKIAHRDLKPQNILIDWHIKIADFGLSKKFNNDDEMTSMCGTRRYAAPEVFDRKIPSYNGCKADIYSLGIILHDLVTNYGRKQMSSGAQTLFKKLTSKDPLNRPTATHILKDKWLERYSSIFSLTF